MKTLSGRLVFSGTWLERPWALIQPDGSTVDLYPTVHEFLVGASGRRLEHAELLSSYAIRFNPESKFELDYRPDNLVYLRGENAGSNVSVYVENVLTRFSGRLVEVVVDEKGFTISIDPTEEVHAVRLAGVGNTGDVSEAEAEAVCGFGRGPETCIFLAVSGEGLQCWKFESMFARNMLSRLHNNRTQSKRVGSCAIDVDNSRVG